MQTKNLQIKRLLFIFLSLLLIAVTTIQNVSAESLIDSAGISMMDDDCVIPESGPWPPCATDGGIPAPDHDHDHDECVIPESGPWPPCATGGNANPAPAPANPGGNGDCVIPESGPWPPCATNGGGNNTPAPANPGGDEGCVIPPSGPWPPCATNGNNNPAAGPGTNSTDADINARIDLALEQLQVYWQAELRDRGVNYRPPSRVVTYEGDPDDPPNAFYIPAMDAVFIDMRLLREITAQYGVYASVAVLAHEWGHFIQDQLNILTPDRPLRRIELQADCFAGSFTKYLQNTGQLAAGEFEAGRQLFYSVGDDIIDPEAPYNRPGAHGTAVERQTAYTYGFDTNASSCLTDYH